MTKKHLVVLADVMRQRIADIERQYAQSPLYLTVARREIDGDVKALADFCAAQNGQFNRQRWLEYIAGKAGPNGGRK
jgi:hypothetical protein